MSGQPAAPPTPEEMWQIIQLQKAEILEGRKEIQRGRVELASFKEYVEDKMMPLEEQVFAPKRLSKRDREAEVERATRPFRNPGEKRTVGFLADLRIDVQERQEALQELNSMRSPGEGEELGDFRWRSSSFRDKLCSTMEYLLEEAEASRRKVVELLDHYHIAKDSRWGWKAVEEYKAPSTFDHGRDAVPIHEQPELSHEEKKEKMKKSEKEAHFSEKNKPSGGKSRGGSRFSSGSSSNYRNKVDLVYLFFELFIGLFYDDVCMTTLDD